MKNGLDKTKLTRTNRIVYKKFHKANKDQQRKMIHILKDQLDNLALLYALMESDNK